MALSTPVRAAGAALGAAFRAAFSPAPGPAGPVDDPDDKRPFYAIIVRHDCRILRSWVEASPLVTGVSGALHKKFATRAEAERFLLDHAEEVAEAARKKDDARNAAWWADVRRSINNSP